MANVIKLSIIVIILLFNQFSFAIPKLEVNHIDTHSSCLDNQTPITYQYLRFCINNQNISSLRVIGDSIFLTLKDQKTDLFFGEDSISKQELCEGTQAKIKNIEAKVGVSSVNDLFSKLVNKDENSDYLNKIRSVFNISQARSLTKYNNSQFTAYWINSKYNQRLYIILKDNNVSSRLFFIQGDMNQEMIKDMLSYLVLNF